VFTKQKFAADFVITVPYEGKSQNKTCCAFCESGSLEPIPQNTQRVLCGSGFAQNVHEREDPKYLNHLAYCYTEPKKSGEHELHHGVVAACSEQKGPSNVPPRGVDVVPQTRGEAATCDSSEHESGILQQQQGECGLPEITTTTKSDAPPVVSWAMKVRGSYTKQQLQQDGKLRAIASPAKRART
jgi:hypothetical protein